MICAEEIRVSSSTSNIYCSTCSSAKEPGKCHFHFLDNCS